jgi:membrane associated rhomboid family serine protease
MALLAACFAVQQIVIVHLGKPFDAYLALSGYGMKSCHLWELFTYQFLHLGWIQFLLNLAGLWLVGRPLEAGLGRRRFLYVYLGAVLAGGVLQGAVALAGFLLPESQEPLAAFLRDRFGGPVVGASVGLCGVVAAFCLREPKAKIGLGFCPPIQARHCFWAALGLGLVLVIVPTDPSLAHLAHLGGLLAIASVIRLTARCHPSGGAALPPHPPG